VVDEGYPKAKIKSGFEIEGGKPGIAFFGLLILAKQDNEISVKTYL